jgi:hypothetical protein
MSDESTTHDLVAILRWTVGAFARGDFDGAASVYSPQGVLDLSPLGIGTFEGRDAIGGFFADWFAPYEEVTVETVELRNLGNDVSFGALLFHARLPGSDRFVEVGHSYASTWADGLIERTTAYADPDEARAAAERLAKERE